MRLIFDDPDNGTELVRTVSSATTVQVQFEPLSPNDTLVGAPSELCNSPAAGQPLVFDIPGPEAGTELTATMSVRKAGSSSSIRVPIKIKHNI